MILILNQLVYQERFYKAVWSTKINACKPTGFAEKVFLFKMCLTDTNNYKQVVTKIINHKPIG